MLPDPRASYRCGVAFSRVTFIKCSRFQGEYILLFSKYKLVAMEHPSLCLNVMLQSLWFVTVTVSLQ